MLVCFSEKKVEMMRMGRSSDELKDKCLFLCCKTDDQVAHIAARGVEVKSSDVSSLGKFIFLFTVTQHFYASASSYLPEAFCFWAVHVSTA